MLQGLLLASSALFLLDLIRTDLIFKEMKRKQTNKNAILNFSLGIRSWMAGFVRSEGRFMWSLCQ